MIPTTFREQAKKWSDLTLAHVSNAILVVHHFIRETVRVACPEEQVRVELWSFLLEELTECYRRAMDHARFLLHVELDGRAVTCNPQFEMALSQAQTERTANKIKALGVRRENNRDDSEGLWLLSHQAAAIIETATEVAIHDVMKSYYEVTCSRFVDNVCTQVVDHFLMSGEKSPLRVLSSARVNKMTPRELEIVAGEEAVSRSMRDRLKREIATLEEGQNILRG